MRQSCSMLQEMNARTGEPCARKPYFILKGEVGKGQAEIPAGRFPAGRSTKQYLAGPLPH